MKEVSIVGIGLIGGSFAMALKQINPKIIISGIDNNAAHTEEAIALGIIDKSSTIDAVSTADLVVLAVPVNAAITILPNVLNLISDSALVIDMGSTKSVICKSIASHPRRSNFLATHPIAGTEFSGPSAAFSSLYFNKTTIICELKQTSSILSKPILELFETMGMTLRFMSAEDHDKHIAYVSHLSHISSFMLGKTVIEKEKNERNIFDMAGSGFASTVRLAKSSPEMWTPIFEQNKDNVIETLDEYIQNLTQFKLDLQNEDFEAIYKAMKNTNHIKKILKGIA